MHTCVVLRYHRREALADGRNSRKLYETLLFGKIGLAPHPRWDYSRCISIPGDGIPASSPRRPCFEENRGDYMNGRSVGVCCAASILVLLVISPAAHSQDGGP